MPTDAQVFMNEFYDTPLLKREAMVERWLAGRGDYDKTLSSWAECRQLLSEERSKNDSLHQTIARIWKVLGIADYASAGGKEISEIVAERLAGLKQ